MTLWLRLGRFFLWKRSEKDDIIIETDNIEIILIIFRKGEII